MAYDVEAIRKRLKQSMGGKFNDPDQFKPATAKSTSEPIKYRFFILPPLQEGDVLKSGTVKKTMDQFFIRHADHWFQNKPTPCPRMWDNSDCPICQFGFDLLRDEKDDNKRRDILGTWMPTTYYLVNIYFTNWSGNPEELRGKVKFYRAPKTCFDQWSAALLRDDKGDDEEPQAHGVFFDENAAFLFQLEALRQGRSNSYKTSKFITSDGLPVPMVGKRDQPNTKGIATLLKLRHNLWDKVEEPEQEKIDRLFRMMDGDDDDDDDSGFDEDETVDETVDESKSKEKSKNKSKGSKSKKKEEAEEIEDEGPIDDADENDEPDDEDEIPDSKPVKESEEFDAGDDEDDDDDVGASEIDALLNQLQDDDD